MNEGSQAKTDSRTHQSVVGLTLCVTILACWAIAHIYGVFLYEWSAQSFWSAPLLVATSCWLYVGLFIIAHDCMHGSLVPYRQRWNIVIGHLSLFLYAGFDFAKLNRKHHHHHRHSGTENDPDFDPRPPHGMWNWYIRFIREYFTWREFLFLSAMTFVYLFAFQVRYENLLAFWALPAMLSSFQLFYFGTYLPHRPDSRQFADRHRAHDSDNGWLWSLLTCFHFGYHHDHHIRPNEPWWRLPQSRASRLGGQDPKEPHPES